MLKLLLTVIGWVMIIATVVPLVRGDAWWIRVFDFPRLQIAVVSIAVLVLYTFTIETFGPADLILITLLGFSVLNQAYMIYPYTPLANVQVEDSRFPGEDSVVSLLFANVYMENRDASRLREIIRREDPDIFLAAEPDEWWRSQLAELEADYSYTVLQPQDNTYGMLLYSKLELINPVVKFLVDDDIPSIHSGLRLRNGVIAEIRCLHPRPPVPTEDESATARDAEILIVGRENRVTSDPYIVFGDLNDVAWSRTNYLFQNVSGLLDPRIGRGFYHTFHTGHPLIRFPLDHCFHSGHFRLVDFRRLDKFGSDHFPVFIKLSYEPDALITQEVLVPHAEELSEAREKIAAAL